MANDVTTLGIGVDSSGVRKGTDDLEKMARTAETTAAGVTALVAKVDALAEAMNRKGAAVRGAKRETDDMTKAMAVGATVGTMLGNAIVTVGGAAFQAIQSLAELSMSLGDYQDLADRTMADPAGLARLQVSADVAKVSIGAVATSIGMMQTNLAAGADGSKRAAAALESIGLRVQDLKNMRPDEQLRTIAQALAQFDDSGQKLAVLRALYGRGGGELLALMKELGNETGTTALITNEMIREADDLGDSIARQRAELRQLIQVMGVPLLEVTNDVGRAFRDIVTEMTGVDRQAAAMAGQNVIRDFAYDAAIAIAELVAQIVQSKKELVALALTAGVTWSQLKNLMRGNTNDRGEYEPGLARQRLYATAAEWMGAMQANWNAPNQGTQMVERLKKARDDGDRYRRVVREQQAENKRAEDAAAAAGSKVHDWGTGGERNTMPGQRGPSLISFSGGDEKGKRDKVDQYERSIARLGDRIAKFTQTQREDAAAAGELTQADRLRIDVLTELDRWGSRVSDGTRKKMLADLAAADAAEKYNRHLNATRALGEDYRRFIEQQVRAQDEYTNGVSETVGADKLRVAMLEDLRRRHIDLTPEVLALVDSMHKEAAAQERATNGAKNKAEALRVMSRELATAAQATQTLREETARLERELMKSGATGPERDRIDTEYQISELRRKAQNKRDAALVAEPGDPFALEMEAQARELERQISLLEQLFRARERLRKDSKAGVDKALAEYSAEAESKGAAMEKWAMNSMKGIEDAMTQMVMTGKADVKSLIDTIISEFIRIQVIRPMLANLFGNGGSGSGIFSFFASILPGFADGLDYVPRDNFVARLHKGERVLTAEESKGYSKGGTTVVVNSAPVINVDARADASQVYAIARSAVERGNREMLDQLKAMRVV